MDDSAQSGIVQVALGAFSIERLVIRSIERRPLRKSCRQVGVGDEQLAERDEFHEIAFNGGVGLVEIKSAIADDRTPKKRDGKTHRLLVSNGDRSVNVSFTPLLHIDDPEGVRLGVIQGAGIAVLPTFLVIDDLESGTLREVLPEWRQAPIPVNILYRTHVAPPIRVRAYVDYLLDSIGKTQPWRVR